MDISSALAADLALVTDALDDPRADVAESVRQLAADALLAVPSFLGLTVVVSGADPSHQFTTMVGTTRAEDIRSSLLMPALAPDPGTTARTVEVILYAGNPGAFVDLATDLAWMTGSADDVFALDRHLSPIPLPDGQRTLEAESLVNQAIGVLIGDGLDHDAALRELDARAGGDRLAAAEAVLAAIPVDGGGRTPDEV